MESSILPLILHYGVPLVALMLFAGEIGIPTGIPMEITLLLAGAYAVHSLPELFFGLALVTVADLSGTTLLHLVARTGGVRLLTRLLHRHAAQQNTAVERWRRRLGDRDVAVVFVGRLLPLVRMSVAIALGLIRIPVRHFLLGAAPAALLWAGTPLTLGYLFRADVQAFAARYTALSQVLLLALPAVSLIGALVWWVRDEHILTARIRRVRIAVGLVAVIVSGGYLIKVVWAHERSVDRGLVVLPLPVLLAWLALLGGLALALLWQAAVDLRIAHGPRASSTVLGRLVSVEVATTVAWVILVGAVGLVVTGIELRYPALKDRPARRIGPYP